MAGTGEEARSSSCRTARYTRSPQRRQAQQEGTAAEPLEAHGWPCRAAAGLANPKNAQEKQMLRCKPRSLLLLLPSRPPKTESEDHDRFSTSAVCHELLHPITLDPLKFTLPPNATVVQITALPVGLNASMSEFLTTKEIAALL